MHVLRQGGRWRRTARIEQAVGSRRAQDAARLLDCWARMSFGHVVFVQYAKEAALYVLIMIDTFEASVGLFSRGLGNLKVLLKKGETHASSLSLLDARLADDMYTLATQVHWACEGAKLAIHRLLGAEQSPPAQAGKTFPDMQSHIDETLALLAATDRAALQSGLERTIGLPVRGKIHELRGDRFLLEFAIPSFYFHLTAAYAILRHEGVDVQKGDFLGELR
jgi:hypothetical protein